MTHASFAGASVTLVLNFEFDRKKKGRFHWETGLSFTPTYCSAYLSSTMRSMRRSGSAGLLPLPQRLVAHA